MKDMSQKSIFENSTSNAYRCQANYNYQGRVIRLSLFGLDNTGNLIHSSVWRM